MAYLIWFMIGVVVAMVAGVTPLRRSHMPLANGSLFGGAFGGLLGGIVSDGLLHAAAGRVNLTSIFGAAIGALLFCLALYRRGSDIEY